MCIFFNCNIPKIFPIIFIVSIGVFLSACNQQNKLGSLLKAPESFLKHNHKAQITRETISKLPYASLAAKIHSNTPSLIILGQILNDQFFWYSSEKEVLITHYGRIIRSYGLKHNIWGLRASQNDVFKAGLHTIQKPLQQTFTLDLDRKAKQNLRAIATYSLVKHESITIYDINYDTVKISEKVYIKDINWYYENFYWVDQKTGFIWQSIQHLHPKLDPIEINVLKRVAP